MFNRPPVNPSRFAVICLVVLVLTIAASFSLPTNVSAQNQNKIIVTIFWGDGCPHCALEIPYLLRLKNQYPNLEIRAYELYYVESNLPIWEKMAKAYGFEATGVPTTFIGDKYWVGYSDGVEAEISATVKACASDGCKDAAEGILTAEELAQAKPLPKDTAETTAATSSVENTPVPVNAGSPEAVSGTDVINVPLIGAVDLQNQPLVIATLLIGFVDGVNPCSIWALTMLLAITLHTGSRKKVLIIGLVFITVTAAVYAMFIMGIFTAIKLLSFTGWFQVVVALVALFFSIVNIKDYFWYKEGISFTIADEKKPGIYRSMRRVLDAGDSFWGLVGATIVLAAGVSLVEFSCTAGFPVIWSNLISAQKVTPLIFGLLLLLYMVIYQLDELGIFLVAVVTLKSSKMEEKHGRILKLIGGTLMLALAIAMLVNPHIMTSLSSSLIVFGSALAATLLILLLHRRVLPAMGIYIGTEMNEGRKSRKHRKK
ncbi:MAG: thioredoxin family protein [Leptolinea sp.]|nr:thioredoxin family protein [Leptolinea sp.]